MVEFVIGARGRTARSTRDISPPDRPLVQVGAPLNRSVDNELASHLLLTSGACDLRKARFGIDPHRGELAIAPTRSKPARSYMGAASNAVSSVQLVGTITQVYVGPLAPCYNGGTNRLECVACVAWRGEISILGYPFAHAVQVSRS